MSSLQIRDAIKGSIAIGKGEQGIQGVKGDKGDNNVCIGLSPTSEAEIWFDTNDGDNTKEVATKEYIDSEIAKIDSSNFATKTELSNKADKEHIHNQYLTEHQDISHKVDKVNGKSLIFDSEIERLSTLKNYDDSNIRSQLNDIENEVNELKEGNIDIDLANYVTKDELLTKADKTELHSHTNKTVLDGISSAKVTEWNNKSTFSGSYTDLTNKPTIPTLNGYATEQYVNEGIKKIDVTEQLTDYAKKSELHSHSNKNVLDGITSAKITEWDNKSTFDGNYNNLTNKPTMPTKTSQLNNDSGFITSIPNEYITETELNEVVEEVVETKVTEVVETKVDEIIGDTLEDKINESLVNIADYNVKNYGAKGDGVTDDTNAIISAINDFTLKGGNKLIFPSGSYKITSPLLIDLNNNRFMSIEMNGYILPNSGVGSCISLINGANVNAIIKVKGGTDVTGLDCALYVSAISGLVLTMFTEDIIGIGCKIVNCNQSNINIISTGCDTALSIDGLSESNININSKNDKNICYVSSSTNSIENVNFKIIGKDTEFTGFETSKGEWLFDSVTLTGKFNKVIVDNKEVYLDIVNSHIREISLPRYNNVRVSNNRYGEFPGASPKDKTFCV